MPDWRGIFPPIKAFRRGNTLCISRRNNAEWREKARPDGVQRLLVQVLNLETTDQNGSRQLLSQTLNTKSGGETQTPFYIAVLASFA